MITYPDCQITPILNHCHANGYVNNELINLLQAGKNRENEICGGCGRTKKACQAANGSGCDRN